jgi:hypothetical protein
MNPFAPVPAPDYKVAIAAKGLLAILATAILVWQAWSAHRGRPDSRRQDLALALVAALSAAGWWNFGAFHFVGGYVHYHEFFHYYLGSKYFSDLGYTGLYDCVVVFEVESGRRSAVSDRWIRDLTTNELRIGSPAIDSPRICLDRFESPERWQAFKRDAEWFRQHVSTEKWEQLTGDHGFNATPVWTMAGSLLANTGPASRGRILALALIDPALILAMFALVWWAFGWRVLAVALVWWGTNYPARYTYIGGAFLREDWLLALVAAVCFAKRGRPAASGAAVAWATLLRVFPGFVLLAVAMKAASDGWAAKRLPATYVRFAAGGILATVLLAGLSLAVVKEPGGGISAWTGFVENSRKHLETPLTNNIGLPTVVTFDPNTRSAAIRELWMDSPWDLWKDARIRLFEERVWIYFGIVVLFLAMLARAAAWQPWWMALVLGVGTIPFLTNLTCYYYGFLLIFAALWPRYPLAGIGLTALSAITCMVPAVFSQDDDRYMAIGFLILLYVGLVTASLAWKRAPGGILTEETGQ